MSTIYKGPIAAAEVTEEGSPVGIVECGPFYNMNNSYGGYFTVCGWSFGWFQDGAIPHAGAQYFRKTRDEALRAAEAIQAAALAGNL